MPSSIMWFKDRKTSKRFTLFLIIMLALGVVFGYFFNSRESGKLEYRKGERHVDEEEICYDSAEAVYLINTSKKKKITFLIKANYKAENKTNSRNDKYTLYPSEEQYIGCTKSVTYGLVGDKGVVSTVHYNIVSEYDEN